MPKLSRSGMLAEVGMTTLAGKEFTTQELAVAAWLRFGRPFGLRGFEDQHPDHKCVCVEIARPKGEFKRRLVWVRPGVYRMGEPS